MAFGIRETLVSALLLTACGGITGIGPQNENAPDGGSFGGGFGTGGTSAIGGRGAGATNPGTGGSEFSNGGRPYGTGGYGYGGTEFGYGGYTYGAGGGYYGYGGYAYGVGGSYYAAGGHSYGGDDTYHGFDTGGYYGAGGVSVGGCCTAAATCNPGDMPVPFTAECGQDSRCYLNTACCSSITCSACSEIPTCDPGDFAIAGPCPPGAPCYETTACGVSQSCLSASDSGVPTCPEEPRGAHYMGTSPSDCTVIDFSCPSSTQYFNDGCGCGCVQDATCPVTIDCQPTVPASPQNPLCDSNVGCPYSTRVY